MKLLFVLGAAVAGLMGLASTARAQGSQPAAKPAEGQPAATTAPAQSTEKTVYVLMKTSMGDLTLELNHEKAPVSVDNFLGYADKKFYDGTIFHRVIDGFMIQGGGFTPDLTQKKPPNKPIKNEWQNGLKNTRGSVAMARIGGAADSATSQFFINVKDNDNLDKPLDGAGYAVFGKVVDGLDVVDKIRAVKTSVKNAPQMGPMRDVPVETVTITEVRRLTPKEVESLQTKTGAKK
jgi:cyclophilin family peptidyl-prolyl cis-trans isomerase